MKDNQFNLMIKSHRTMLDNFAMKFTGDLDDAQDLIQDTMVKALRFFETFDEGTNLRGWLYTIMRNTFINDYKKTTRKQSIITQEEDITYAHLLSSAAINKAESTFALRDINLALDKLPESLSVPFIRYVEGYKYHEIADKLGIPLGTVKTHIREARKRLCRQLSMYRDRDYE